MFFNSTKVKGDCQFILLGVPSAGFLEKYGQLSLTPSYKLSWEARIAVESLLGSRYTILGSIEEELEKVEF